VPALPHHSKKHGEKKTGGLSIITRLNLTLQHLYDADNCGKSITIYVKICASNCYLGQEQYFYLFVLIL